MMRRSYYHDTLPTEQVRTQGNAKDRCHGTAREYVMVRDDHPWPVSSAQFYEQLYQCAWETLAAWLGPTTTDELFLLSRATLQDAYPFLARVHCLPQGGIDPVSVRQAMATEERAHVEAGCEQLLQGVQTLAHTLGGAGFAQRLHTAIEAQRLTLSSRYAGGSEAEGPLGVEDGAVAAQALCQTFGHQALRLYKALQAQREATAAAQAALQALQHAAAPVAEPPTSLETPVDVVRSEAFYHSLFDLSPDGVLVADSHGIIVQANSRAADILECESPQDLIGLNALDLYVHPEQRAVLLEQVAQRQYLDGRRGELRTRRGRTIIVTASNRLIDYEGQPCLLSVIRDVTDRARLQQEMEDFAYSASHDLQAPLRTFEGYARWLLEDYGAVLDSAGRQLCEEIIDDALHMKKLLDGLLEYSRIGRLHTQAVPVEVRRVLDRVVHDLQMEIHETGAVLHIPDTLPTVLYPEVRLTQIFTNLLSNALKFTAGKRPEIALDWEVLPRHYRFSVRDNGIGIAPEHFGRIFEIFKRLHTREAYPGTGAGLTIVKKIVESHGGEIGVSSTPGVGSTFWFTIPKTEAAACAS